MKFLSWLKRNVFKIALITLLFLLLLMSLAIFGTLTETKERSISQQATTTNTTTRLYINKDGANFRACPSTTCKITLFYDTNSYFDFSSERVRSVSDLPEWVPVTGFDINRPQELLEGYIHKSNFSDAPIALEQKPETVVQTRIVEKDSQITSADLKPYLSGVVQIDCYGDESKIEGSGSIWDIPGRGQGILTNAHVTLTNIISGDNCRVWSKGGAYSVEVAYSNSFYWNSKTDAVAHKLSPDVEVVSESIGDLSKLNYSISKLNWCPPDTPIGTPVAVIGYPAFGKTTVDIPGHGLGSVSNQVTTNGIVSGSNTSPRLKGLPADDYFVSAKIDSGNSGGIALAKIDGKMCVLGIPTWVSVGNYDTQGLIQNIHNIFYKPN